MSLILRGLLVMATAGALSLPSNVSFTVLSGGGHGRTRPVVAPTVPYTPTTADFKTTQLEYYLGDDGIAYIRPGLQIKVNSITIGADRRPVVDLNFTDNFNQPLDRLGQVTPGAISASMIMAWYDPTTGDYTAYTTRNATSANTSPHPGVTVTQAGTDSGGTWTDLETGHATYKFKTVLPSDFDQTKTTTLGIYATRNLTDIIGKNYYANVEKDFRPDGGTVTNTWGLINATGASSCNNCHDPLEAHGGSRRDPKLCALCHTPQTIDPDTGNTVDFKVMVHKIHDGPDLANGYTIIGHNNSVNDYSDVTYPQDIRNCATCHEGSKASDKPAQYDAWYTRPTRAACGSCHDSINWETGENHAGGSQANDDECADCHVPDSGLEFDASIIGGHTIPLKSKQLAGLNVEIVSITNVAAGESPTVVFKITNNDGSAVDGTQLATFSPILAGPTSSYRYYWRESGKTTGVYNATDGTTTYTFSAMIPADATGTWAISGDFYRNVTITQGDGDPDISVRESAVNPIDYAAVTGAVMPRRTVVTLAQCNSCHDQLALHGGQRMIIEECVICHNPTMDDSDVRPTDLNPPESISFQRMIHRIHKGETLTQDFTIYGHGGSENNYNEVTFPGDVRDCAKCHSGSSYVPPLPTGIDSVITLRDYFSPQGPSTASCLGCHDNQDAAAHAWLNTTTFPGWDTPSEACASCHGAGKDWAVDKVHAE